MHFNVNILLELTKQWLLNKRLTYILRGSLQTGPSLSKSWTKSWWFLQTKKVFLQKIFYQSLHFSKLYKLNYLWYKETFRYFLRFISLAYMFMEGFWTFIQYSYPNGLPRRLSYYSIRFKKMVSYNVEEGDNGFVSHVHVSDTYMSLSEQFTGLYLLKGANWKYL